MDMCWYSSSKGTLIQSNKIYVAVLEIRRNYPFIIMFVIMTGNLRLESAIYYWQHYGEKPSSVLRFEHYGWVFQWQIKYMAVQSGKS